MKRYGSLLFMVFVFLFAGCTLFAKEKAPYVLTGEFVCQEGAQEYSICGVDFYLYNKAELEMKSAVIVFFLFDSDGEPIDTGRSSIKLNVKLSLQPKTSTTFCVSLDEYMNSLPEETYFIDYLYISKIEYADGSEWNDAFGMAVF